MADKLKASQFLLNAKKYLGWKYIYAAKGEKYTVAQIKSFAKLYPKTYTSAYLAKTLKNANMDATDCSGLIYLATGKKYNLSSSMLYSRAKEKGKIVTVNDAPLAAILWREGHVGIKYSSTEHIEARGVDSGVVIMPINSQKWTHALLLDFIDYAVEYDIDEFIDSAQSPIILKINDKNDRVKLIQNRLINLNYSLGKYGADGSFGAMTETAIKQFQKDKKITQTGQVDIFTLAELCRK